MKKILVVGDVMIDRYWKGLSTRLSPEAPVPVVKIGDIESRLGGAANVALNLASVTGGRDKIILCGLVGNDFAGNEIRKKILDAGICDALVLGNTPTIEKIRIIAQNQQIVRADFEQTCDEHSIDRVLDRVMSLIDDSDCVVFSDYQKGVLKHIPDFIRQANKNGLITLIDPKGNDYSIYAGATVITPNKAELAAVVGDWKSEDQLVEKAQNLRSDLNLTKLLLTRSEEGMTLFGEDEIINIPTVARDVYDVSGAGDTVIAVLASMLASNHTWIDSVNLANRAAGIVVGRFGTSTVSAKELGIG